MDSSHKKEPPRKRYRKDDKSSESEPEDDKFEEYVPVKERRKQQLIKLGRIAQLTAEAAAETKSSSENDPDDEG